MITPAVLETDTRVRSLWNIARAIIIDSAMSQTDNLQNKRATFAALRIPDTTTLPLGTGGRDISLDKRSWQYPELNGPSSTVFTAEEHSIEQSIKQSPYRAGSRAHNEDFHSFFPSTENLRGYAEAEAEAEAILMFGTCIFGTGVLLDPPSDSSHNASRMPSSISRRSPSCRAI